MPTTLITGANRGIGLELTRQYLADDWDVIACCRNPDKASELAELARVHSTLQIESLDVTDHAAIDALSVKLADHPIDVLLNNAGIIGPFPIPDNIERQHFGSLDFAVWEQVLRVNTFGPIKMAEAFIEHVGRSETKKIASLSSTVGSIVERDTAAFAYATSKTALNKTMTLLGSELRESGITVLLFCPGYVKTRMDFGGADIEIVDSARGLRELISSSTLADSGSFRRFNGERISW